MSQDQQPVVSFGVDYSKGRDQSAITRCEFKGKVAVCRPATCEEFAEAYVDLLYGPENAWGQNVHPTFGQSHSMLHVGHIHFGKEAFDQAVDDDLAKRNPNTKMSAFTALKRFVKLSGGNTTDIKQVGNEHHWTDPDGVTHKMGWKDHADQA